MTLDDVMENNSSFNRALLSIEEETLELEKRKQQLQVFKYEIMKDKNKQFEEVSKYSTFNTDDIGNVIAQLLTITQKENYKYMTCLLKAKKYWGYDYINKENEYLTKEIPIKVVVKEKDALFLKKPIDVQVFNYLLLNTPIIIIDHNEMGIMSKNINLYNQDFGLNLNSDFLNKHAIHYFDVPSLDYKYYDVIKNYIDKVVNYRMQNEMEIISDRELYDLFSDKVEGKSKNESLDKYQIILQIMEEYKGNLDEKKLKKEKR